MNAFEPLFWLLCAWIAIRIVKGASPRLWLLFGVVAGLGLENKHSMLVFGFALVVGLLLSGQASVVPFDMDLDRRGDRTGDFSAEFAVGSAQRMAADSKWFATRSSSRTSRSLLQQFLFEQVLFLQPLALPVWLSGLWWYFASPEGKRFRFLGWAYLFVLVDFHCTGRKIVLRAAGLSGVDGRRRRGARRFFAAPARRWMAVAYPALLIVAGIVTLPFGVPVLPVNTFLRYSRLLPYANSVKTERDSTAELPQLYADMFGWENMATQVASVYHALPQSEQAGLRDSGGKLRRGGRD